MQGNKRLRVSSTFFVVYLMLILPMHASMVFAADGDESLTVAPQVEDLAVTYVSSNIVRLTWTAPQEGLEYYVFKNGVLMGTGVDVAEYIETGIAPDLNVVYQVRAHIPGTGDETLGIASETISVKTKSLTEAPKIDNVVVDSEGTDTIFSFTTDEKVNVTLTYWTGNDEKQVSYYDATSAMQTEYAISEIGLSNGEYYKYYIEICNDEGICKTTNQQTFFQGTDTEAPSTDEMICPVSSNMRLTKVAGRTDPFSDIDVYVDDIIRFSQKVDETGTFILENIPLGRQGASTIKFVLTDPAGNTAEKLCSINYDNIPPNVVIGNIPAITRNQNLDINISTDEIIDVVVTSVLAEDEVAPTAPSDLTVISNTGGSIRLEWTNPVGTNGDEISDVGNYVVYRDGKAIATVNKRNTNFEDGDASTGLTYEYKVLAVDESCNLGDFSNTVRVESETSNGVVAEPDTVINLCTGISPEIEKRVNSELKETISLEEGKNKVTITAVDLAGNIVKNTYDVIYDSKDPEVVWTNLDDLEDGLIYVSGVTIRGEVSEEAIVYIFVNEGTSDELVYEVATDSAGNFAKQVTLSRTVYSNAELNDDGTGSVSVDRTNGEWPNDITVYAVDLSGRKSKEYDHILKYGICGDGGDWQVNIENILPTEIIPRHLIEGIATVGFSYELKYLLGGDAPDVTSVNIKTAPLNTFQSAGYDKDWVSSITKNAVDGNKYGYVQINLLPQDPTPAGKEWTIYQMEEELSKNHQGKCLGSEQTFGLEHGDLDPLGIGCFKLPLLMEIQYAGAEAPQKHCIDLSIMITPRIPPDYIPTELLKAGIAVTNTTANVISGVQEITSTLRKGFMIACGVSFALNIVSTFTETAACFPALPYMNKYELGFEDGTAYAYKDGVKVDESEDDGAKEFLNCYNAKVTSEDSYNLVKFTCDRNLCGVIPSFDNYVGTKHNEFSNYKSPALQEGILDSVLESFEAKGSYCTKFKTEANSIKYESSEKITDNYESLTSENPKFSDLGFTKFNSKLMAARGYKSALEPSQTWGETYPELCEEEYMYEYDSACVFADPYTESFCAFADNTNIMTDTPAYKDACTSGESPFGAVKDLVDSISICKAGSALQYYVRRINDNEYYLINDADEGQNQVYYIDEVSRFLNDENVKNLRMGNGYAKINESIFRDLREKYANVQLTLDNFVKDKIPTCNLQGNDACLACNSGGQEDSCCPTIKQGVKINPSVAGYLCGKGEVTKANIIDPTGGLFESVKCLCISALDSYLAQIKQVMELVRDCFQTIAVTGDGSAGTCQNILTIYVCDIFHYAFKCVKDYVANGYGSSMSDAEDTRGNPVQNALSVVSLAGSRIEQNINGRYGQTSLFQALFTEKKLVNSVCLFAFTGEWPTDFEDLLLGTDTGSVPIEPILSCIGSDRRFQSFDPISGVATYVYSAAPLIISGADDLSYTISLVCSNDYSCDGGEPCDCSYAGVEKELVVTGNFGNGKLGNGETLNEESFVVVDALKDSVNNGKLRYDKIKIKASYTGNEGNVQTREQVCDLAEAGGEPPAICHMDLISTNPIFRCDVLTSLGATYFSVEPTAEYESYSTEKLPFTIGFNSYTIYKKSPDMTQPLNRALRITATDSQGRPVYWNAEGTESILTYPLTVEGQNNFGDGATGYDVPSFYVPDRARLESTLSNECVRRSSTGVSLESGTCNNLDVVRITFKKGGDEYSGTYDYQLGTLVNGVFSATGRSGSGRVEGGNVQIRDGATSMNLRVTFDQGVENPEIILHGRSYGLDTITQIDFKFEIVNEDGNVVAYSGEQQSKTVTVKITAKSTEEDTVSDGKCIPGELNTASSCTCGNDARCSAEQRCCVASRPYEGYGGECISGFKAGSMTYTTCDSITPIEPTVILDPADKSILLISNIKDEALSGQTISSSARVFVKLSPVGGQTLDIKPVSITKSSEQVVNPSSNIIQSYNDVRFDLDNALGTISGCFNVGIEVVDAAGNYFTKRAGSIKKNNTDYVHTAAENCDGI